MFPMAQRYVAASDAGAGRQQSCEAQRLLWDRFRLIAEPGGATALAALLSGRFTPPDDARVGVLVCGANTDPAKVVVMSQRRKVRASSCLDVDARGVATVTLNRPEVGNAYNEDLLARTDRGPASNWRRTRRCAAW